MTAPDAFLLAGGRSTRMGRDKAAVDLGGRTLLERAIDAARPVAARVVLVGRDGAAYGIASVSDRRPGTLGPLAGIESALAESRTPTAIVLACDMPFVSTALLEMLVGWSEAHPERVVVPVTADGRIAPLCAVYPSSALAAVSQLLDAGERRPRALEATVGFALVPFDAYAHLPNAGILLTNVNTPEELESARRRRDGG
jgi:molybdopterin-guanine dinucleotide biosynthesis protein A